MSGSANQLFVGRLPRGTRARDLEDIFYKYGKLSRCDVKQGENLLGKQVKYAFSNFCLRPFSSFSAIGVGWPSGIKMGEL